MDACFLYAQKQKMICAIPLTQGFTHLSDPKRVCDSFAFGTE